jgi:RNA polymerase sigma-70 factor (sigma-E family)
MGARARSTVIHGPVQPFRGPATSKSRKGVAGVRGELEQEYVEFAGARLPAMRKLAYLLCGDPHRAEDLVQQTFVKLYTGWRRARAVEHLDAYVRAMLVRAFLNERRRAWATRVDLTGSVPERAAGNQPDVEQRAVLRAALNRLPPRQRAVLVLRFLCDLPIADVAALLGCSPGTVKSQTSHGLTALRRTLDEPAFSRTDRS